MDALLREMAALNVRKRGVAVVENGSWAPAAGKEMATLLAGMTEMELLGAAADPEIRAQKRAAGGFGRTGGSGGRRGAGGAGTVVNFPENVVG